MLRTRHERVARYEEFAPSRQRRAAPRRRAVPVRASSAAPQPLLRYLYCTFVLSAIAGRRRGELYPGYGKAHM
eukprot:2656902-Pleurochrysis_carterae.AAC.2